MGYDLHITRRRYWPDEGSDITADEWLAYVRRDSELRLQPENGPHYAVWSGPSELSDPWLNWSSGEIYTKHPDPALIDKMVAIARELRATVQGDDGELYQGGDQVPQQPTLSLASVWPGGSCVSGLGDHQRLSTSRYPSASATECETHGALSTQ